MDFCPYIQIVNGFYLVIRYLYGQLYYSMAPTLARYGDIEFVGTVLQTPATGCFPFVVLMVSMTARLKSESLTLYLFSGYRGLSHGMTHWMLPFRCLSQHEGMTARPKSLNPLRFYIFWVPWSEPRYDTH